eukprot:6938705-Pyramimonas_sp.AAC.1
MPGFSAGGRRAWSPRARSWRWIAGSTTSASSRAGSRTPGAPWPTSSPGATAPCSSGGPAWRSRSTRSASARGGRWAMAAPGAASGT